MLRKIINRVKKSVSQNNTPPNKSTAATASPAPSEPSARASQKEVWEPGRTSDQTEPRNRRRSTATANPESTSESRPPRRRSRRSAKPDATAAPASADAQSAPVADENQPPKRRRRRRSRGSGKGQGNNPEGSATTQPSAPPRERKHANPMGDAPLAPLPAAAPKNIAHFDGQLAFAELDIPAPLKQALDEMHFKVTTPIQARLLPIALAGRDAAGKAQTGTGKTAAFLITIFTKFLSKPIEGERPHGTPRALILAPTRELALQIKKDAEDIGRHCGLHTVAVYGGMDFDKQQRELEQPVDVIVATPGRLMDFAQRKVIHLRQVEVLVIDEADRMLDMGFIPDVRKIVRMTPHPEKRQTLLFSATLTPDIMRLAEQWTRNAETVEIEPERVAAESVNQRVIITTQDEKFRLLYNLLIREKPDRVIVFSNRRDQAEMLHEHLKSYGFDSALLSGAVDQKKRVRVLDQFKAGEIRVLVATDVAGRGLHVDGISHVINYHMPMDPDDYVHRIGRTGRAGEIGTSISFACELDSFAIPDVEAFIGHPLVCEHPDDELLAPLPEPHYRVERKPRTGGGGRGRSGSGGGRPRGNRSSGGGRAPRGRSRTA